MRRSDLFFDFFQRFDDLFMFCFFDIAFFECPLKETLEYIDTHNKGFFAGVFEHKSFEEIRYVFWCDYCDKPWGNPPHVSFKIRDLADNSDVGMTAYRIQLIAKFIGEISFWTKHGYFLF